MTDNTTKTVTITIEEYQDLLANQKTKSANHAIPAYKLLCQEMDKDFKSSFSGRGNDIYVKNAEGATTSYSIKGKALSVAGIRKHIETEVFLMTGKRYPAYYNESDVEVMRGVWERVKGCLVPKEQGE